MAIRQRTDSATLYPPAKWTLCRGETRQHSLLEPSYVPRNETWLKSLLQPKVKFTSILFKLVISIIIILVITITMIIIDVIDIVTIVIVVTTDTTTTLYYFYYLSLS